MNERTPHRCPVCEGRGSVPPGFYRLTCYSTTALTVELCRTCAGGGLVWEPRHSWGPLPDYNTLPVPPGSQQDR